MRHKILIHAPNLSTPGGKQTYFASLKGHLISDIDFFFYGSQGKKESILKVPLRLISDYWKFYKLLNNNNYHLVHLNPSLNPKSFFRDSIFALICRLARVKMTVFWHGWQWGFEKKVVCKILPWFRMTYGTAQSMIVLGQEFGNHLKTYGFKNPIFQITTVADPIFFKQKTKFLETTSYPKTKEKFKILFLSRIEKVKGIYESITAFERLKSKYPELELIIAGTGGELQSVKNYVENNAIPDVVFLGWVTGPSKLEAFTSSDVYLLPSYHGEGLPCSLLEAMAVGLPVISTDVGGIKDFFENEKMGYLVKMKDPDDLFNKLELLINTSSAIPVIGRYNFNYASERFTPERVGSKLEDIYAQTIAIK